jgi:hypothetical protein
MLGPAAPHLRHKGPASSRFQPVGRPICIVSVHFPAGHPERQPRGRARSSPGTGPDGNRLRGRPGPMAGPDRFPDRPLAESRLPACPSGKPHLSGGSRARDDRRGTVIQQTSDPRRPGRGPACGATWSAAAGSGFAGVGLVAGTR